jgi:hypothetical protein
MSLSSPVVPMMVSSRLEPIALSIEISVSPWASPPLAVPAPRSTETFTVEVM